MTNETNRTNHIDRATERGCRRHTANVNGRRILAALAGSCLACACGGQPVVEQRAVEKPKPKEIEADVSITEGARVRVDLDGPKVLGADDPKEDGWDLTFEGLDVFTNSGPSGPGAGAAFGPLAAASLADPAPPAPFLVPDSVGGAFTNWYLYDGHTLRTRFHVYAVRDGTRIWKLQVLGYYGDVPDAPVSGLYGLRYSEVTDAGSAATVELSNLQGTSGSGAEADGLPGECVDLASGDRMFLTLEEAAADPSWHLCFRHESILVNGGLSGPRGVEAVDLDRAWGASESAADVRARTSDTELSRFDAVNRVVVTNGALDWKSDSVVSAFSGHWIVEGSDPPTPVTGAWLVQGSDGASEHLVVFESFEGASPASPGTLRLRAKPVE